MSSTVDRELRVLLVEDDELERENLQRAFKKNGITVELIMAFDGYHAYGLLTGKNDYQQLTHLPDVVLLDINMPKMNGIELLKEIRANEQLASLQVYILTSSTNANDVGQAYGLNVAGYIVKPIRDEEFVGLIRVLANYWSIQNFPEH